MKKQAENAKKRNHVVRNWDNFQLETVVDVRFFLAFVLRKMMKGEISEGKARTASDVAKAILKTHELERAVPEAALIGLARLLETAGATMVQNPGQGMGSPESQSLQGVQGKVPDGTRGPEELQDGTGQAKSDNNGVAE